MSLSALTSHSRPSLSLPARLPGRKLPGRSPVRRRRPIARRRLPWQEARRIAGVDEATRRLLLGWVLPLWMGSGFADWLCHRRSDIEHTAGPQEALIHMAMMAEGGVPVLIGLFLEVNAGVLATTLGALGLHQATAAWDVAFADSRREVTTTEQHVHGLLEQVPVMATAFLVALHWDQARALVGRGPQPARFALQPKRPPLSRQVTGAIVAGVTLFGAVPYAEETVRCLRTARERP